MTYADFWTFLAKKKTNIFSFEDTFLIRESIQIDYKHEQVYLVLFSFHLFLIVFSSLYLFYLLVQTSNWLLQLLS
jgi:hypothetical protein